MSTRRHLAAALSMLALLLAACGSDNKSDNASTPASTPQATETPADGGAGGGEATPPASEGGVEIVMKGFAFSPADATAKVGEKVTWKNEDSAPHNAVSDDGELKTATINNGQTTDFTPTKAGKISYICTIHPSMKATLTVTE